MKLQFFRLVLLLGMAAAADAHFVFVVPDASGRSAIVFLNEELKPTTEVDVSMIGGTKLSLRGADGRETSLKLVKGEHAYTIELPSDGTRLIHGVTNLGLMHVTNLGLMQMGQEKPYLLIYHPKAIVGDPFSREEIVGNETPVEIVPLGKPGAVTLELLVHGKPQPDTEITIILPDGTQKKVKTNRNGQTDALPQTGRYGAWARYWEQAGGERDGKKYDETRNYATLVFDTQLAPGPSSSRAPVLAAKEPAAITATRFVTLPEATSSFGEVVSDGWLYVYGGHIAHTHSYSTDAVSGRFERLKLSDGKTWEQLPGGPGLQGMNLAAYRGKIYRIGGMEPRNKPGQKEATFSVADCARFDPATKKWDSLPPLPEPRSSHDVVVTGSKLIVVGGWTLKGPAGQKWLDTLEVLDLSAKKLEWKSAGQPFRRRALIAAVLDGKMYVMGGLDDHGKIVHDVAIYDSNTDVWTSGPPLPGEELNGFSPAACVNDGVLYVSVADGSLYKLSSSSQKWEKVGTATPRVAHRIGSWGGNILISGGAAKGNNSDLIESVSVSEIRER